MVVGAVASLLALPAFAVEEPSAGELLAQYAKAQDKLGCSFISKHISTIKWEASTPLRPDIKKGVRYTSYVRLERRSDGNRHYSLSRMWGDRPPVRDIKEEDSSLEYALWDGKLRYRYSYSPNSHRKSRKNGTLRLTPAGSLTAPPRRSIEGGEGAPLRGFFYGTSDRIDVEFRAAESISVLRRRPVINGSKCYVIDARVKGCEYRLWIDPQHDYQIAKAVVKRGWQSAQRPEDYARPPKGGVEGSSETVLKNVRFKKIDDFWVPVECDYTLSTRGVEGDYGTSRHHHEVMEFIINPNHDALRSFEPDFIREGALVRIRGTEGKYKWRNGEVIDDKGLKVEVESVKVESDSAAGES
ncbi:MAG: hypothetical protein ACYST6_07720 [Planctomycetota bacterium]|jgi:hypothetical protein